MYEFQDEMVERLVAMAKDSARHSPKCGSRVCLVLPTGAGKTVVAARVAKRLGGRTLLVAHRRELIDQAVTRLVAAGVPASEIGVMRGDDGRTDPEARVQVASIQTFVRREWSGPAPTTIIVDEAHHATSKSYAKALDAFPAAFVLGLTATPVRMDGTGLSEVFETLEVGPAIPSLIATGVISSPRYFSAPDSTLPDMRTAKRQAGDFRSSDAAGIMVPLHGAIVPEYLKRLVGIPTLCFAVNVEHAQTIARAFEASGVRATVVTHETKPRDRARAIKDLEARRISVIVNVDVFGEGTDLPFVRGVILARPTLSETIWRQQVGRAMRPHGTEKVIVHDHVGACWLFGHPGWDRPWSLTDSVERRVGTGAMRSCPSCGEGPFSVSCATCPECGEELREMADRRLAAEGRKVSLVEMVAEAKAAGRLAEGVTALCVGRRIRDGWSIVDAVSVSKAEAAQKNAEALRERMKDPVARAKAAEALRDPVARAKAAEALRERMKDPAARAKKAEAQRERMKDPAARAKAAEALRDPAARAKKAEAQRERMKDPAARAKLIEALRDPAARAKAREAMRERMKDPAARAKALEALRDPAARAKAREAQREAMQDPAARAKVAEATRERMKDPAYRAKAVANLRHNEPAPPSSSAPAEE